MKHVIQNKNIQNRRMHHQTQITAAPSTPYLLRVSLLLLSTLFFCVPVLKASLSTARMYHSYLVKVTNNSSKTFRLYCSNKDWDTVLFLSPSQLDLFTAKFEKPLPKDQIDYADLVQQRNIRVQALKVDVKTEKQIEQDPQIKALDAKIKPIEERLRPVIKPHSVADDLPCRIFGPDDIPSDKPKGWHWPEAYLKGGGIKIEFTDTNKRNGCPQGNIKIIAKSTTLTTSLCVDNSLYFGRIHLTIEEDGTFKLEQLKDIPLQP